MINKIIFSLTLLIALRFGLNSNAFLGFEPAGDTAYVGNTQGGGPVPPQNCPYGLIAIGMEAADQIAPGEPESLGLLVAYATRCGEAVIDYTTGALEAKYVETTAFTKTSLSNNSGPVAILDCPIGTVLVGYAGYQNTSPIYKMEDGSPKFLVDALRPRCSAVKYDTTLNRIVLGAIVDANATKSVIPSAPEPNAVLIDNADCPIGSLVNGFSGRTGNLFDLFQLSCVKITQSTLIVSIEGPDYADYDVVVTPTGKAENIIGSHKVPLILEPGDYSLTLVKKSDGSKFENFVCTPDSSTTTSPYTLTLVNEKVVTCTILPTPTPTPSVKILTVGNQSSSDIDYINLVDTLPEIIGTSSPSVDVMVKDQSGNDICKTKSDSLGNWKCTPTAPLTSSLQFSLTATTSDQATSNKSLIQFVVYRPIEPVVTVSPIKTTLDTPTQTPTPATTPKPHTDHPSEPILSRTGGIISGLGVILGLVAISILAFKKYRKNV